MKTIQLTCNLVLLTVTILSLDIARAADVYAQSTTAQSLINRLMSTINNKGTRHTPRAELARAIGKDKSISPKDRVDVLSTVLRNELENHCPLQALESGRYLTTTLYIQRQYVFALADVGSKAIPHLRTRLDQVRVAVQNISPSLGNTDTVDVAEMQHTLCALGLLADKDVLKDLLKILEDEDGDGYMRQMAAMALGKTKNKTAIPVLLRALTDDFQVTYPKYPFTNTIYPVREAAYGALRTCLKKKKVV